MNLLDWILVAIRWAHALAAVAWVGGGMFYVIVLSPVLRQTPASREPNRAIGTEFRGLINTAIGVLLVTGTILSVSRLTSAAVTLLYVVVLVVKIALAFYMFYVVWFLSARGGRAYPEEASAGSSRLSSARERLTNTTAVLIIGVVVFGLADVLDVLFEKGLAGMAGG